MFRTLNVLCSQQCDSHCRLYYVRHNPKIKHVYMLKQAYRKLPPPHCNGHFQRLLGRTAQVHCFASVLLAGSCPGILLLTTSPPPPPQEGVCVLDHTRFHGQSMVSLEWILLIVKTAEQSA